MNKIDKETYLQCNITTQSLEKEIAQFQKILQKYKINSDYVNPNIPKQLAESILYRLSKEYYLGYRID